MLLKKSGCKIPRIELEDMGPSLDLVIRRTHLASDDLYKLSLKQPKALKVGGQVFIYLMPGKSAPSAELKVIDN